MKIRRTIATSAAAIVGLVLLLGPSAAMAADIIYDNISNPLPPNEPSLGYQATQTSEFGDEIQFSGTARNLTQVTVTLSDWALYSDWSSSGYDSSGYSVPMTLNLYNVGTGNSVGSLIASNTTTQNILWRPEASAGCGTAFLGSDGNCYNGLAQTVTFDFTGTVVPDEIVFGLAFNTQSYGANPTGVAGPYNSLNFALNDVSGPSVGTDVNSDAVFWNTSTQSWYANYDPSATAFQKDTAWAPYVPAVQFAAVPEPATWAMLLFGFFGVGFIMRGARRKGAVATA